MRMENEIEQLKAEITRLNDKIHVMRSLLCEWNGSSCPVWENRRLKALGETIADYADYVDEDDMDLPLADFDH